MKKLLFRVGLVVALLLVVAAVVVFFSLNSIVKKGVETLGPQMTKVEVRLGAADLSPFSGKGRLTKLFVGNPDGYKTPSAIQVGDMKLAVSIGSVMSDTIVVDEINIQAPEITLDGSLSGNNLSKILDNLNSTSATAEKQKNEAPAAGTKKQKKFIVKDLVINAAKVNVNISVLGQSVSTSLPIPEIHLQNMGTAEGGISAAELSRQILKPILVSATDAATKYVASLGKNLKGLGSGSLDKAGGILNNLLKK
ncbi:MAG: hypothetical protein JWR26_2839 [Pedosphaera sp.]|nr:hypothetical protein [Pedosphaera sp.]